MQKRFTFLSEFKLQYDSVAAIATPNVHTCTTDKKTETSNFFFPTNKIYQKLSFHLHRMVTFYRDLIEIKPCIKGRIIKANIQVLNIYQGTKQKTNNT